MTGGANCAAWGRFRRRRLRPVRRSAALCCAVCVLACAWACAAALRGRGGAEREVLLQTEGIRVVRGAPVGGTVTRVAWETLCGGRLLWLDERHPLPAGFPGPDTRGVRKTVGAYLNAAAEVCLDRETVQALCDMVRDGGLPGLRLVRGACSLSQLEAARQEVFDRYRQVYGLETALARAEQDVPAPDRDEHRLGGAVDVAWTDVDRPWETGGLARSPTGRWLTRHMAAYGFIAAPEGRSAGEGRVHLRYVGALHARLMAAMKMDLQEYLTWLAAAGRMTVELDGTVWYVYSAPLPAWGEDVTVRLPAGEGGESLDNLGGAVFWRRAPGG